MFVVGVGVEQGDGHGVRAALFHQGRERLQHGRVQRLNLFTTGTESAGHTQAVVPRHQGWWPVPHQRVELGPVLAPDLDDVLEALVGDEDDARTPALQKCVGGHGGSVKEVEGTIAFQDLPDAVQDRLRGVGRRGRHLERRDPALVEQDQVREGATGIDSQQRR